MTDQEMNEKREVMIPFSGLYQSWHSLILDDVGEFIFSDQSGNPRQALIDLCWCDLRWDECHKLYAQDYAEAFLKYVDLPGEFAELVSPREYNFFTDRIFVNVPAGAMEALYVPVANMGRVCRAWFTSCSGFASGYSADWLHWGAMDEWDHNQMGARLVAWMESKGMDPDVVETEITGALGEHSIERYEDVLIGDKHADSVARALKIQGYLMEREDRRWAARRVASMEQVERRGENE